MSAGLGGVLADFKKDQQRKEAAKATAEKVSMPHTTELVVLQLFARPPSAACIAFCQQVTAHICSSVQAVLLLLSVTLCLHLKHACKTG